MMLKLKGAEDAWILPGSPLPLLKLVLINESSHRLHIKITDPSNQRWEIPERYVLNVARSQVQGGVQSCIYGVWEGAGHLPVQ